MFDDGKNARLAYADAVGRVPLDLKAELHQAGKFLKSQVPAAMGHSTAVRGVRVKGEKAMGDCRLLNCVLPEYSHV